MSKLFLAAGVAALAIAAPSSAKPGGGHGGGGGDHGGGQAAQQKGGGGHGGGGQAQAQAKRGGGGGGGNHKADNGGKRFEQARKAQQQRSNFARKSQEQRFERANKQNAQAFENRKRSVEQARKFDDRRFDDQKRFAEQRSKQFERVSERNRDLDRGDWNDGSRWANARGLMNACPPGLAKKGNDCMPPGQAKKLVGRSVNEVARIAALSAVPQSIRYLYPDSKDSYFRYGDGYVYRVNRQNDLVSSLIPLLGGGLLPGQMFPTNYTSSYVPNYFNAFYPDTPYVDYRYANGNAYAVNPVTGMIENVIPNYGFGYGVGQALPAGFGYYNVPHDYRDMYYNTANTNYWYAPGAIYQVDPQTQLITSVASLLAPGLTLGQQLPVGYSAYNVPLGYRDTYYDTPNAWYRYNNGNIYQVDPTTQLVTAIVASILT